MKINNINNLGIQLSYLLNSFIITLIFILFIFTSNQDLGVDFLVSTSVIVFLCQIISANRKNIAVSDQDNLVIFKEFVKRLILFPLIAIFSILFNIFFLNINNEVILTLSCILVLFQWTNELIIGYNEINKKFFSNIFFLISTFILFILLYIFFILDVLTVNYFFFLLIPFLFLFIHFILRRLEYKNIYISINQFFDISDLSYMSSIVLTLANLIIRISIYKLYVKDDLAIIFLCFSIASLLGSIITQSIGISYISKNILTPLFFRSALVSYFIISLISLFLFVSIGDLHSTKINLTFNFNYLFIATLTGLIAALNQSIRIIRFSNSYDRNNIYLLDLFYAISAIICVFVFLITYQEYLIYSLFINSLIGVYIYINLSKFKYNKIET